MGSDWSQLGPGGASHGRGLGDGGLMFGGARELWPVSEETVSGGASLKRRVHSLLPATLRSQQN